MDLFGEWADYLLVAPTNQPTNPLGTYKEYTRVFARIGKGSKPPEETSKLFLSLAQVDELCVRLVDIRGRLKFQRTSSLMTVFS